MSKATIYIDGLKSDVYIGATEEERRCKQKIKWFVAMSFFDKPKACKSDMLEDTLCYDRIVDVIIETSQMKEYNLLEHLVATVYDKINNKGASVLVRASKVVKRLKSYTPSFELKSY